MRKVDHKKNNSIVYVPTYDEKKETHQLMDWHGMLPDKATLAAKAWHYCLHGEDGQKSEMVLIYN